MESNQDSATLALQIQALTASVEELTRKNQEMRLQLQKEENWSRINQKDKGDSQKISDSWRLATLDKSSSDLFR